MDKQIEVLPLIYDYCIEKKYPVSILVGGRNSGKTYGVEQVSTINLHNNEDYKLLVVEDVEVNVGEGVKSGIENRIEEFGLDMCFTSVKAPAEIRHVNGNNVIFRGYHSEAQQKQVKSLNEITAIWYEEAENITYKQFSALRMQLRGGKPEDRQLFLTLNPVRPDGFIAEHFFGTKPDKVFEWFPDGRPKVFEKHVDIELEDGTQIKVPCIVICSTYRDNPYLTLEQIADIEDLKNHNMDEYEQLANCKFIKPQGAFFKEFTYGIHTCEPFEIPDHWRKYRTFDYGFDKFACLWIALDDYGKIYVYKEAYKSDLIISDTVEMMQSMTMQGEEIYETFAPPDMWNRRQETGKSVAEYYEDADIYLTKAKSNRVAGWLSLKEHMKIRETAEGNKESNIVIFNNCENLIRCLPKLMRDKANPNDVDSKTDHELTHAPDALRYFVAGRPAPAERKAEKIIYNFSTDKPKPAIGREKVVVL